MHDRAGGPLKAKGVEGGRSKTKDNEDERKELTQNLKAAKMRLDIRGESGPGWGDGPSGNSLRTQLIMSKCKSDISHSISEFEQKMVEN